MGKRGIPARVLWERQQALAKEAVGKEEVKREPEVAARVRVSSKVAAMALAARSAERDRSRQAQIAEAAALVDAARVQLMIARRVLVAYEGAMMTEARKAKLSLDRDLAVSALVAHERLMNAMPAVRQGIHDAHAGVRCALSIWKRAVGKVEDVVVDGVKSCRVCGEKKLLEDFRPQPLSPSGVGRTCDGCLSEWEGVRVALHHGEAAMAIRSMRRKALEADAVGMVKAKRTRGERVVLVSASSTIHVSDGEVRDLRSSMICSSCGTVFFLEDNGDKEWCPACAENGKIS